MKTKRTEGVMKYWNGQAAGCWSNQVLEHWVQSAAAPSGASGFTYDYWINPPLHPSFTPPLNCTA